jgi:hypothetical protein
MRGSKDAAERKVANEIMKTAASLMQLSGGKAPYQRYGTAKGRMTAMQ